MLALIVLHIYLYGWNVYLWRKARINYAFIFEFAPGKELRYREILLVSSGLLTLFLGGMLAHLGAHYAVDRNNQSGNFYVDIIPLGVVAVSSGHTETKLHTETRYIEFPSNKRKSDCSMFVVKFGRCSFWFLSFRSISFTTPAASFFCAALSTLLWLRCIRCHTFHLIGTRLLFLRDV